MPDTQGILEEAMVEKAQDDSEFHLHNAEDDGEFHFVRVGEGELVISNLPDLYHSQSAMSLLLRHESEKERQRERGNKRAAHNPSRT